MGVPHFEGEDSPLLPSPSDDADSSGQDRQELSANGQSVLGQPYTSTETDPTEEPRIAPVHEAADKFTPKYKHNTDVPIKRLSESQPSGSVGATGGGSGFIGGGVSVTWLTLDADIEARPNSQQQFLPSPRTDRDHDMSDLRLIRDFQVRRKYGRRPNRSRPPKRENFPDLGLSGRRYFGKGETVANGTSPPGDTVRAGKTPIVGEESGRLPNGSTPASSSAQGKTRTDEGRTSVDSTPKDLQSPVSSFPPLSPVARPGMRSENSFYSSRHSGQSPSLLINHFGFSTIRPDTFSGMQKHRMQKLATATNEDLIKELEQHAQKQILACQNMGYTHRGSRAAESVLSLKHTVSPSAFHPSSIFTRHVPREERVSRSDTPAGMGEGEERPRRRVTPAGKLSMPRLLVQDRQGEAARRATLPTVSGNSLQVVLAQSHGK